MAQNLLQNGLVKTPEQFIQVMQTGRLEPVIEGEQAEIMLIKDENEHLMDGKEIMAISTDDHIKHIKEHKVVLASIEARKNDTIVPATLAHIQEHIELLKTTDPGLLAVLDQPAMGMPPGADQGGMGPMTKQNPNAMGEAKMPELPQPAEVPVAQ